jgi:AraC-like DNA-binding protein
VIQAMHYIRNHACKGIKVDQVLDSVGISRSNLEKRFKEEVGETIHAVIHAKTGKSAQPAGLHHAVDQRNLADVRLPVAAIFLFGV